MCHLTRLTGERHCEDCDGSSTRLDCTRGCLTVLPGARGRVSQRLAAGGSVGSTVAEVGKDDVARWLRGCLEARGGLLELTWVSWDA